MFLLLISVSYPSHPDFWRNNNIFKNRLKVYSSFCLEIKSVVHLTLKGLVILSLKSPARNIEFVNDLPCRKVVQWKALVAWAEMDKLCACCISSTFTVYSGSVSISFSYITVEVKVICSLSLAFQGYNKLIMCWQMPPFMSFCLILDRT